MKSSRGFTLVELLVVMAIITILANLLLPAVRRARDRAYDAHCKSNLHQWGVAFALYHEDRGGDFEPADHQGGMNGYWPYTLRDYFEERRFLLCPKAVKPKPVDFPYPGPPHRGSTFHPWWARGWWGIADRPDDYMGSYGKNGWVANPAGGGWWFGADPEKNAWQNTVLLTRTDQVPMLLDSTWVHTLPLHADPPPPAYEFNEPSGFGENMKLHCIDRHDRAVNGSFLDGSVRRIGLKELWTLEWHPLFNTENRWTDAGGVSPRDWPAWMHKMEDY